MVFLQAIDTKTVEVTSSHSHHQNFKIHPINQYPHQVITVLLYKLYIQMNNYSYKKFTIIHI